MTTFLISALKMVRTSMVNIYYTKIYELDPELLTCVLNQFPTELSEKYHWFRMKDDRLRYLFSRILLRNVLSKYPVHDAVFYKNSYGKPFIRNSAVYFNISHSGEYTALSVGDEENGIDIEKIEHINIEKFKICFTNSQWRSISKSDAPYLEFYQNWTIKESFMKLIGKGFFMDFNSFEYHHTEIIYNGCFYKYKIFNDIDGYSLCCCTRSGNISPKPVYISPEMLRFY
ncbi:MAG: 4'-phosphopantetheinyl transferase superfamily protein [Clostridiales bacterium]|nr:4'-phosphopantetheinyl transferase superfamily protein [Clostridiales bacterium]